MPECTVNDLISYMINRGGLRDAQIEAIKTYLFLKIACEGKPLNILFSSGKFNSIDLDNKPLSRTARECLRKH